MILLIIENVQNVSNVTGPEVKFKLVLFKKQN